MGDLNNHSASPGGNMHGTHEINDPKHPRIMTFRPTMEEFQDFLGYVHYMESCGAHLGGIAKIIPPKEWKPRKGGYGDLDSKLIYGPIRQCVKQTSTRGAYEVRNTERPSMTVGELRKHALEKNLVYAFAEEMDDIERNFWKQLTINPPVYGADTSGSLFDEDVDQWNISRLPSILDTINEEYGIAIQGVNTPYLYYGMWRAFFGWHTEDLDLYSINYIHDGAAKFWYSISPQNGRRFERLAAALFPDQHKKCHAFLRHKSSMISHTILKSSGVPFNKIMQHEGEIIITFPFGYHAGFNCGLNVAESTNFATERWIEYGKYASICSCQEDNVKIDMTIFVRKYQPDRLSAWEDGTERGRHPEDDRPNFKGPPTSGPCAQMFADFKKKRMQARTPRKNSGTVLENSDGAKTCIKRTQLDSSDSSRTELDTHFGKKKMKVTGRMRGLTEPEEIGSVCDMPGPLPSPPRRMGGLMESPTKLDHNYFGSYSDVSEEGDSDTDASVSESAPSSRPTPVLPPPPRLISSAGRDEIPIFKNVKGESHDTGDPLDLTLPKRTVGVTPNRLTAVVRLSTKIVDRSAKCSNWDKFPATD
ncbi:probable lysine-specific demethylase 4A [Paramacrobiotus metropolitanus]|uniref:probable lysine-specific demethylase 4A n=1 Tax=Paramacrobiotus metropolitanus TaxID=2943436 RepID=UPI0024464526|nr:probable lysine-specific demethylase 4A [Paramacrobiotus metropolitanus]